jgi:hypothetical protein
MVVGGCDGLVGDGWMVVVEAGPLGSVCVYMDIYPYYRVYMVIWLYISLYAYMSYIWSYMSFLYPYYRYMVSYIWLYGPIWFLMRCWPYGMEDVMIIIKIIR